MLWYLLEGVLEALAALQGEGTGGRDGMMGHEVGRRPQAAALLVAHRPVAQAGVGDHPALPRRGLGRMKLVVARHQGQLLFVDDQQLVAVRAALATLPPAAGFARVVQRARRGAVGALPAAADEPVAGGAE